jgi:hypothetical protein
MDADFDVARTTLETYWTAAHPEFHEAFARARELSQAWWERQGRENLGSERFQAALYSRSMSARFPADWRESKQLEHSGPGGQPIRSITDLSNEDLMRIVEGKMRVIGDSRS